MGLLDGWQFCPRCQSDLVDEVGHLRCATCEARYWANSVPGAQAVIERDGCVLLGLRRDDPGAGRWDLPGGFLDEGENAVDALRREVLEETGLEVEPAEFLGTWNEDYWDRTVLCLTWLAHVVDGVERPGDDLTELRWFGVEDRPQGAALAFPTFDSILGLWASRYENI